jgi:putative Holliday junction resolvase
VPRVLAVDWGERRIGLAVSDPGGVVAGGLETLHVRGRDDALGRLERLAAELSVERIVVGLPLLLSGEVGEAARAAQDFARRLQERTRLPVDTLDERLTSALSERRLRDIRAASGRNRSRKRTPAGDIDRGAAVALLETYLERLSRGQEGSVS